MFDKAASSGFGDAALEVGGGMGVETGGMIDAIFVLEFMIVQQPLGTPVGQSQKFLGQSSRIKTGRNLFSRVTVDPLRGTFSCTT